MVEAKLMRQKALSNNPECKELLEKISKRIEEAAGAGRFECGLATEIYREDILDYAKNVLTLHGFTAYWELSRGVNCSTRYFTIRWC